MTNGGAPYNIVKNLRTMNVDFALLLIGLIGNDFNGKWIIDDCIKSNIDINQLEITSCTNGLLDEKYFNFSETNAKLFYLGPLTQLNRLDTFNNNDNKRTNASKVLENTLLHGLETIVDFSSGKNIDYSHIAKSSLPFIDHLIINETEAGLIFTKNITSDNLYEIKQIANDLIDSGVRKTVTIHFTEGDILMTNDKNLFLQGSIVLREEFIKGSVEDGDTFVSGLIYGIHQQWSLDKTLHLAVCIAAMSLSHESSTDGMKDIEQCLNLQKYGFRRLKI
ncbi:unnamed protein product [Adineta steineri]|uniref:Carbohydrate kinase PfkB domain-containing protein n=2 Tax=Adineta steineri TaxID=433720 RepID=A0A819GM84_9BILA|nr:unnamed protein product [Adineta steineri]